MNFILFGIKVLLYEETHNFATAYNDSKIFVRNKCKILLSVVLKMA